MYCPKVAVCICVYIYIITVFQCDQCQAVFHSECKTDVVSCPKCQRRLQRQMKLGTTHDDMDYTYDPDMEIVDQKEERET